MKKTNYLTLFLVLIMIFGTGFVIAQGNGQRDGTGPRAQLGMGCPMMQAGGQGMGPGAWISRCCPGMNPAFNLTETQLAEMKKINEMTMADSKALREQVVSKKAQLAELWKTPDVNANAIKVLNANINALISQLYNHTVDATIAQYNLLTNEQKQLVAQNGIGMSGYMQCGCCGKIAGCMVTGTKCDGSCPMMMGRGYGPMYGSGYGTGRGPGAGMQVGPRDGSGKRTGPKDGTGPRAQQGTCLLQ